MAKMPLAGGLNNKPVFLIVLEAGKFQIKALADQASGESFLQVCREPLLIYSHRSHGMWGGRERHRGKERGRDTETERLRLGCI